MAEKLSFPHLSRSIENFLYDEEGNIPRNKVLAIGSMMIILGVLFADERLFQSLCKLIIADIRYVNSSVAGQSF